MAGRRKKLRALRKRLRGDDCVYCGQVATTEDHFPPVAHCLAGFLLPACSECNSFAGERWPTDFERRCEHVGDKIRKRYAAVIDTPDWAYDEIEELGQGLQDMVAVWQAKREHVIARLAWRPLAYIATIDHNKIFMGLIACEDELREHIRLFG